MPEQTLSNRVARQVRGGAMPHVPPPASPVSSLVQLELEAPSESYPVAVIRDPLREHGWRVALEPAGEGRWQASIMLPQEPTILRYHFELVDGSQILDHRQFEGEVKPVYGVWVDQEFKIAVYTSQGQPPVWVAGQVMYQIFPDRFAQGDPDSLSKGPPSTYQYDVLPRRWDELPEAPSRGRDFFGGDLRGVINRLDYIKELGITTIYFTPVFESPTNHRYDAINYFKIDPRLGTEADLLELIEEAGQRGMRVMLDGVFNHCSQDSLYFKSARASRTSPYFRWFAFEEWPDKWHGWIGVRDMPEFIECPEVEDFFFGRGGVALHWLSRGTAGWRTDVTPWVTDEYWRRFRTAVRREYPEAYLIAEDWGDATHRLLGNSFDATMNYRFGYSVLGYAGGHLTGPELDDRLETLRRDTPPAQFQTQMNLISSHDTARPLTVMQGNRERVKLAIALQMAYPGVPMVYYGDEAGLEGRYAEDGRRPYPWDNPDRELVDYYKQVINTRHSSPALKFGDLTTVYAAGAGYGLLRRNQAEAVLALFNNGDEPLTIRLEPAATQGRQWTARLGNPLKVETTGQEISVTLPGLGWAWLRSDA